MSDGKKLNTKASGVIAIAVMFSRVLGLVREVLFNSLFGTASMGLFLIAFRAPNLLRDLFAEGALSTAFVTVFSQRIEKEGPASAWALAAKMMTLVAVFMSVVSLLGVVFAEQWIAVLAPGFAPEDAAFTVYLTRIMYPFILLVSLAALVMGMLNSRNVFGAPAMASSFFNIGSIAGGALFGWWIDPEFGRNALAGLALGTLVGGFLQFAIQLPSLRKVGFRFVPDFRWNDPGIRKILVLMVPSVIAASAVQINVLVNTSFASFVGTEAVTWLNSAFRLMQLPIGVFGVAVATITLPVVSRIAAGTDRSAFGPTLGRAMRLAVFLTLPAAVGLWFLAHPIIGLIYEHGEFVANDTLQTGFALQFYAAGLVAYSCIKVLSPAFYAIDRKWTPMIVSFVSIGLNLGLNYLFVFRLDWGHSGLALSTTISALLNFAVLYLLMCGPAKSLDSRKFASTTLRCALAAVPLGLTCWTGLLWMQRLFPQPVLWQEALAVFTIIGSAALAYLTAAWLLRVEEVTSALNILRRKLLRG
ncbi:MAG: murein biosynthesis integral membrane protein MurJ [Terrimicrobiaceae bacterium]|nr:murein biosynthesis integral membrane protein MurJ [Terrimicrobiaceae bacterium]